MVGTRKANDIQLRDKGIGFKHAQIVVEDGRATIEDLNSKGGTWVGGDRLDKNVPAEIPPNSDIKIGSVRLTYEVEEDEAAKAEEPPVEEPAEEPA
ncbi:MAG TPA: hypothetical protein DEA08_29100, partial [Planctomycetes bacterium]|nr:hypothetical protein [Planctomycetota bacterium]